MSKSVYDEIGGFTSVRKLITAFYDNVLDCDEVSILFENVNMERLIDHQSKFFSMLLGGPASFTDQELIQAHMRLGISSHQFDLTKECLVETMEDFELSDKHIDFISNAFESKRELIVQPK